MTIESFIIDYKINQALLAAHLGIHQTTFTQKLNKRGYNKFTAVQIEKIKQYLSDMAEKISEINLVAN